MIQVTLNGNTYGIKETLKSLGFRWNGRMWIRNFEDSKENEANEIANRWTSEGVYGTVTKK